MAAANGWVLRHGGFPVVACLCCYSRWEKKEADVESAGVGWATFRSCRMEQIHQPITTAINCARFLARVLTASRLKAARY
jgi:hypothetical protein